MATRPLGGIGNTGITGGIRGIDNDVPAPKTEPEAKKPEEETLELLPLDRVGLEIGYRLIPLVQPASGTGILDHILQLRRRFATVRRIKPPASRSDSAEFYFVATGFKE